MPHIVFIVRNCVRAVDPRFITAHDRTFKNIHRSSRLLLFLVLERPKFTDFWNVGLGDAQHVVHVVDYLRRDIIHVKVDAVERGARLE